MKSFSTIYNPEHHIGVSQSYISFNILQLILIAVPIIVKNENNYNI